jgi:hypothetical protein
LRAEKDNKKPTKLILVVFIENSLGIRVRVKSGTEMNRNEIQYYPCGLKSIQRINASCGTID